MPSTKRYHLEMVVRPDPDWDWDDDVDHSEIVQGANVTAINPLQARRAILERAWHQGLLVSRFVEVSLKE